MRIPQSLQLVVAIAICFGAGAVGVFTTDSSAEFYQGLEKPDLSPPAWLFGPVWSVLYVMLGIVLYRIWQKDIRRSSVRIALGLFIFQLILNALWTPIFFTTQDAGLAFVDIVVLDVSVLALMALLWKGDKLSVLLLVPYMAWIGFATWLTYQLWVLNVPGSNVLEQFTMVM
jgi:tryptophan-rich sensory protein